MGTGYSTLGCSVKKSRAMDGDCASSEASRRVSSASSGLWYSLTLWGGVLCMNEGVHMCVFTTLLRQGLSLKPELTNSS